MDHDHLIGQVQHRVRLSSRGEAEVAVRAMLQTLEGRISEGAYQNLTAQLPHGISDYQDAQGHRSATNRRALRAGRVPRAELDADKGYPNINIDYQALVQDRVDDISQAAGCWAVKIAVVRLPAEVACHRARRARPRPQSGRPSR
jgi:uncharacterized protein (DUF2267 family)